MMRVEEWQASNSTYLHAAIRWLRLKLELAAQAMEKRAETSPVAPRAEEAEASRWNFFRRPGEPLIKSLPRLSAGTQDISKLAELREAESQLVTASNCDPAPAMVLLRRRLGLTDFERDTLLMCAATELDTRIAGLLARSHDDPARPFPTFALAMTLFAEPAWEALSPERPLRYWRLLEINQHGAQPLTTSALRIDERIVSFIKGLNYLDDRLTPLVMHLASGVIAELPKSQRDVVDRILAVLSESFARLAPIGLTGRDRESKRQVAGAVAAALGLQLYRLSAESLPVHVGEVETLARLWQRECLLLPLALYIDAHDLEKPAGTGSPDDVLHRLTRFVGRTGGLLFIDAREGPPAAIETLLDVDVGKPTPAEQRAAWVKVLGDEPADVPAMLAGQFNLNQSDIESIAAQARRGDERQSLPERLWNGCLAKTRPTLDRLAEKIDAKARWEHIVLPAHEATLLERIAAQVKTRAKVYDEWGFRERMNRGLGINALFAGESGTGKTMAAEVLANALHLDLYRIDLSAVVSKYIGETEKNLRQVFDAAEDGGAILLFDEADALFGKRSEVKDSHDRYANIEINYLLQRIESYRGLAILATNMKGALDTGFMRRLRFIVNFPFPGPSDRRQIWERAFASGTPLGVLDYQRLSKLTLTGGNIHSIALNAAFLAAQAGTPVTMQLLLEAARIEFRKLERPVNEADFRLPEVAEARA